MLKKNILVFRTGHLGDTICAIPAFRILRRHFENDRLHLLCDQAGSGKVAAVEVCEGLGVFDRILTYRSGLGWRTAYEMVKRVLNVRPNVVIILPQVREDQKSLERKRAFFKWCGIRDVRVGFVPRSANEWQLTESHRLVRILDQVGITGRFERYDIPVDNAARNSIVEQLRSVGVDADHPFILFCGGGKVATQRWPLDRYGAVLRALAHELNWPVVALGNRQEMEQYRLETARIYPDLRMPQWDMGIPGIFELCRMASVYIGNDTGPMHVAAAVDCPVIAIMSARNAPGMWDPDVEPNLVIRHRTECEDCFLSDCVAEKHRCITSITVDTVIHQALNLIRRLPDRESATAQGAFRQVSNV